MPRRKILILLGALAGLLLVARAARKEEGAILRNRAFAELVWTGAFPYAAAGAERRPLHAPYPPSYGIVMGPLLLAPITVCRILWALLQLALLLLVLRLCARWWSDLLHARAPPWLAVLALLFVLRFLLRDMAGGGNNLVFGALVLLACLRPGEVPGEDRRPWTGLGLGVVLAAKPTPLLFLFWLWMRGRRRTLAVALGSALFLWLCPALTLGVRGSADAYGHWLRGVLLYSGQENLFAEPALGFPPFDWMHQSLRYALARFLGSVPETQLGLLHFAAFPGVGLPHAMVAWIHRILTVLLLAQSFGMLWLRRKSPSPWHEMAGPCLLIALTLLLSPITWKAHHVGLLPVFYLLLARASVGRRPGLVLGLGL
ncbi:MAG: glycosyltransferase family 87 protein, partial [Planctomycetota bacterium]